MFLMGFSDSWCVPCFACSDLYAPERVAVECVVLLGTASGLHTRTLCWRSL